MPQLALVIATLLTIRKGAFVRSWNSPYPERRTQEHSWVEGIVEDIRPNDMFPSTCDHYVIRVTADYCEGRRVVGENSLVGQYVYPPVNGAESTTGRVADGVEYLDEIDSTIWGESPQGEGYMAPAGYLTVRQIVSALSARLSAEDLIDEYDALGLAYKYERRGPDGLEPALDADAALPGQPRFEVSVNEGGSEGHYVQVRMLVRDDSKANYEYNPDASEIIYTVKTFTGFEGAFRIAKRINQLLGC